MRRVGTALGLVVALSGALTACGGGASGDGAPPSAPSSSRAPGSDLDGPASADEFRAALQRFKDADSGRFEGGWHVDPDDPHASAMREVLPSSDGSWLLSAEAYEQHTRFEGDSAVTVVSFRLLGGDSYARVDNEQAPFGDDCWWRFVPGEGVLDRPAFADVEVGPPPALAMVARYRPREALSGIGSVPLADALGAVGFQKAATLLGDATAGIRVAVELELEGGHVGEISTTSSDLVGALREVDSAPGVIESLVFLLDTGPAWGWSVRYLDFGDDVHIVAPPPDRLLVEEDDRCA